MKGNAKVPYSHQCIELEYLNLYYYLGIIIIRDDPTKNLSSFIKNYPLY